MNDLIILATINAKSTLYGATADDFSAVAPNIQQALLSQYIRSKGLNVKIIESDVLNITIPGLIEILKKEKPRLLGIIATGANPASSTMAMTGVNIFFEQFQSQRSGITSFVWGPHPTVLPERTLQETRADFVVRHEGWDTIPALFKSLEKNEDPGNIPGLSWLDKDGRYHASADAPLREDLDALPLTDWDEMDPRRYRAHNWHCFEDLSQRTPYGVIWTSFGCPFQCNFCSINNLFGRRTQRFRSMTRVMDEISVLVERHNVRNIKIMDELFVVNEKRMDEFCDLLEPKGYDLNMWAYARIDTVTPPILKRLKKIGLRWISYGFETSSSELLKNTRKGTVAVNAEDVIRATRDAGIYICADVVFGLPGETFASMSSTYNFLTQHNFEYVNMYPVFAYPGTEFFDKAGEKTWKEYSLYGYDCIPMPGKNLTAAEILRFRDDAFIRYHSRPEYLNMIEQKFNALTRAHIERMTKTPLRRRILA